MYKSAISMRYLPNQWYNINQTCVDILLEEGASVMDLMVHILNSFPIDPDKEILFA